MSIIVMAKLGAAYIAGCSHKLVMPGLVPGIHVFPSDRAKDVDGRDKPGHDDVDRRER
jgi:hypothetical protein